MIPPCELCGNQGFVYRALVEGGRVMWTQAHEVPEVVVCPLCYLADLIGA